MSRMVSAGFVVSEQDLSHDVARRKRHLTMSLYDVISDDKPAALTKRAMRRRVELRRARCLPTMQKRSYRLAFLL